jgi:uncharacterized membrane protein
MNADPKRFLALDALRGAIMIVMALDHANAFIAHAHPPPEMWAGFFPRYSDALAFLTRFFTHLAAPGFFFLMGAGLTLFAESRKKLGWTDGVIMRHLIVRGVLLIFLQFTLENFAWSLGSSSPGLSGYFGVLYGLGTAMILGTLFLRLNTYIVIAFSVAAIVGAHLVLLATPPTNISEVALALLIPGSTGNITVYYPTIPWLGVAGFGIAFGRWVVSDHERALGRAFWIGITLVAAFMVVRAWGGFGNIRAPQGSDWIAFLNVVKYPPSIVFLMLTLGANLVLVALFAHAERMSRWLAVFGSSALFFYITHLYLYAFIGILLGGHGTGIVAMYPYWILGLVILFPLCWWYGRFKRSQASDSLLRFF